MASGGDFPAMIDDCGPVKMPIKYSRPYMPIHEIPSNPIKSDWIPIKPHKTPLNKLKQRNMLFALKLPIQIPRSVMTPTTYPTAFHEQRLLHNGALSISAMVFLVGTQARPEGQRTCGFHPVFSGSIGTEISQRLTAGHPCWKGHHNLLQVGCRSDFQCRCDRRIHAMF